MDHQPASTPIAAGPLNGAPSALRRVLEEIPPNSDKNQQYKDTLVWEAVLDLASEFDIVFVTSDKAFFAERDPAKGLAHALIRDVETAGVSVDAVDDLAVAAERLRSTQPAVDTRVLVDLIDAALREELDETAARADFSVSGLTRSEVQAHATEDPDVLAVTFEMAHQLDDHREPSRSAAAMTTRGECIIRDGAVGLLDLDRLTLDWTEPSGEPGHGGTVYVRPGSIHIGERHEPYTVRTEIIPAEG